MITHTWVSLHGYLSAYNSYSTFLDSDTPLMIKQQKDPGQSSWHVTGSSAQSTCSQPSKQIICFPAAPWWTLPRPAASSRTLELKHRWQQGASTSEISEADWFSQCIARAAGWLNSENEREHNHIITHTVSWTYDTGTIKWLRKKTKVVRNTERTVGVERTPFSGSGGGNKDIRKEDLG